MPDTYLKIPDVSELKQLASLDGVQLQKLILVELQVISHILQIGLGTKEDADQIRTEITNQLS